MRIAVDGIEESFDNQTAERYLSLSVDRIVTTPELLRKSMYDFDLETPEGISKLLVLLPIMDSDIVKDVAAEIWPAYTPGSDVKRNRLEITGYLKDYLTDYAKETKIEEGTLPKAQLGRPDASSDSEESGTEEQT